MAVLERISPALAPDSSRSPKPECLDSFTSRISVCTGRRRSRSMKRTRPWLSARERAVLAAMVDFPSPSVTLENRNTLRPLLCSCSSLEATLWMDSAKAKLMAGEEMRRSIRPRFFPPLRERPAPSWGMETMILPSSRFLAPSMVCTVQRRAARVQMPAAMAAAHSSPASRRSRGML